MKQHKINSYEAGLSRPQATVHKKANARYNSDIRTRANNKDHVIAVAVILVFSVIITMSYMNGNIFTEKIALSGFIIICLTLIRLLNKNHLK